MFKLLRCKLQLLVGALAAVGMLAAVSCGAAEEPTPTPPPTATSAPGVTPTVAAPTPTSIPTPTPTPAPRVKRGGIITTGSVGIPHVDISQSSVAALNQWIDGIYQRLVTYRLQTKTDSTLVGELAESWTFSDEGKTITIKLRPEAKWANKAPVNGRPFTSADVAWNIDYYKTKSIWKFMWDPVVSYETPDDHTIVLHTAEPFAPMMAFLAYKYNYMLPREVFEKNGDFKREGIGTGPFVFSGLEEGVGVFSRRNDNYWRISEIDGKPLPYADGWDAYQTLDYATRVARFKAGQEDIPYSTARREDFEDLLKAKPDLQYDRVLPGRSHPRGILINMTQKPWDDVNLRRAVSLAIDRKDYMEVIFSGEATWLGPLPSGQSEWAWSDEVIQQKYPYDPDQARQLVKAGGYENLKVVLSHYNTPTLGLDLNTTELMASYLRDVGLDVTIRTLPDVAAGDRAVRGGDFVLMNNYWTRDDEPHAIFLGVLGAKWIVPDTRLADLVAREGREMDVAKRKALMWEIQEIVWEQMYWAPTAVATGTTFVQPWVRGWEGILGQNLLPRPFLDRVWLDK